MLANRAWWPRKRFMKESDVRHALIDTFRKLPFRAFAVLVAALAPQALGAAERIAGPAESRMRTDVTFLADDAREGRAPGSVGIEAAADYIAAAFKEAGLTPAPGADGSFQPFQVSGQPKL